MDFKTAAAVETVAWQLRLADWPRARNRARLNDLYNGFPPYTEEEQRQNRIATNVNFLEGTKLLHDGRRQLSTALTGGNQYFTVDLDYGPRWKRRQWSAKITQEINRRMRESRAYLDTLDSTCASNILHGIGASGWSDGQHWCPDPYGIEDVLVPSNTYVSLKNLPFFVLYRQYTGYELYKMTHGPNRDPAWNMPLVERAISWVDEQARTLNGTTWPEVWSPEKMQERIKQDGGLYASDAVPTVDALDLFFWSDEGKNSGWRRRIVLDAWGSPGVGGVGGIPSSPKMGQSADMPDRNFLGTRDEFLYNPGKRKYADKLDQIVHFQFADCSCVSPFRYHSVRSLGFLLYSVCHLQNRLRCKFNDATFESLLQYFRVSNPADAQRVTKIDLIDRGVIPDGIDFVKAQDRWTVPAALAESLLGLNRQTMADNAASFTQDFDFDKENTQETATRTMAKVNSTAALIGAMLNKIYNQQAFQYQEIARRFCIKNSVDPDVRKFRVNCLKAGIPEEALNAACWNVQPVRVIGSGNKMLQVAMADKLMAIRPTLDADSQKQVDRIYILANSDDPSLASQLVPESKPVSDSVHDAQAGLGTIMAGLPFSIEGGMNHSEYVEVWLHAMALLIQRIEMTGAMATPQELIGLQNLALHIGQQIQVIAQDKREKARVKKYSEDLAKLTNVVKGYAQRLQEQRQKGAAQSDPKDAAKVQAMIIAAKTKAQLNAESHAQKTAQRQIQFEQQMKQENIRHGLGVHHDLREHAADLHKKAVETAANVQMNKMKSFSE
jgi:hypothetical protein